MAVALLIMPCAWRIFLIEYLLLKFATLMNYLIMPLKLHLGQMLTCGEKRDSPASSSKIIKDSNLLINELSDSYLYRVTPNEDTPERLMHSLESGGVKDFLDHITNVLDDPQVPVEVSVANLRRKLLEISKSAIPSKILFTQKGKKKSKRIPWVEPLF